MSLHKPDISQIQKYSKILADGDLDGFVATSILHQYAGIPAEFPHPSKRKGLIIENSISIEISPSMGVELRNSLLFDHHEYKGVYYFDSEGRPHLVMPVDDAKSVVEVVLKYLNIEATGKLKEILEFVNKVDSSPGEVKNDPRYVGYRVLIADPKWRELYSKGIEGVVEALNIFEKIGREALKYIKVSNDVVAVERYLVNGRKTAFVYPKREVEISINNVHVNLTAYLLRSKMMDMEKEADYVFMIWGQPPALRVSIWSRHGDANKIAKLFNGGGRGNIAGFGINADKYINAIDEIIKRLKQM